MTLEKVHELIATHSGPGNGYNRNTASKVSGEVMRDFGQETVDMLNREYDLEKLWEIKPATMLESAFKS